jgi:hypothetical protein
VSRKARRERAKHARRRRRHANIAAALDSGDRHELQGRWYNQRVTQAILGDDMSNFMMTEKLQRANFIASVLMVIRRNYIIDRERFRAVIANGIVLNELQNNYSYYHMYDYKTIVEELAKKEHLLTVEV